MSPNRRFTTAPIFDPTGNYLHAAGKHLLRNRGFQVGYRKPPVAYRTPRVCTYCLVPMILWLTRPKFYTFGQRIYQWLTRLSKKSRSRQLLVSLDWSWSRQPQKFPVSFSLGLDKHKIYQSWWVSVSTTTKFPTLDESRSRQPKNFPVSMSLGLDNHRIS